MIESGAPGILDCVLGVVAMAKPTTRLGKETGVQLLETPGEGVPAQFPLIHSPVEAVWLESRLEPVFGPKTGSSRDSNQTAFTGSWIRAAWNWAAHTGLVKGIFPSKGFVYPKA